MDNLQNVTKEQLIQFLDRELNHLESEDSRKGFTLWAIATAIAAATWAALGLLDKLTYRDLYTWTYVFGCATFIVWMLRRSIYSEYGAADNPRFLSSIYIDIALRGELFNFLIYGAMIAVGLQALAGFNDWIVLAHLVLWVPLAVFAFLGVVLHLIRFQLPVSPSAPKRLSQSLRIIQFTGAVIGIYLVFDVAAPYLAGRVPTNIPSVQAGLATVAIAVLLVIYIEKASMAKITRTVHGILIQLSLGEIDLETARKNTAMLLVGVRAGELLAPDAVQLANAVSILEECVKTAEAALANGSIDEDTYYRLEVAADLAKRISEKISNKLLGMTIASTVRREELASQIGEISNRYQANKVSAEKLLTSRGSTNT